MKRMETLVDGKHRGSEPEKTVSWALSEENIERADRWALSRLEDVAEGTDPLTASLRAVHLFGHVLGLALLSLRAGPDGFPDEGLRELTAAFKQIAMDQADDALTSALGE